MLMALVATAVAVGMVAEVVDGITVGIMVGMMDTAAPGMVIGILIVTTICAGMRMKGNSTAVGER